MKQSNNDTIPGTTLGLGARIKLIRDELGISLERFGEKLSNNSIGANFTKSKLSQYERGAVMPGSEFYIALRETMDIDLNWVLTGIGVQYKAEPMDYEAVAESVNKFINKAE